MLEILYLDEVLVAVNKPAGMLVHRSAIDTRAEVFVLQLLRDQIGQWVYPVHRLDRPTSGVLLFALSAETAHRLAEAFARHEVEKHYLAVVRGFVDDSGCIDQPLKESKDRLADRFSQADPEAQPAITRYVRLATAELPRAVGPHATARYSLVRITPSTGRKHQIRRHFSHLSHPVIGDTEHGDRFHNRFFRDVLHCSRLLLAAIELTVIHPLRRQPLTITAPLDPAFLEILRQLNWLEKIPASIRGHLTQHIFPD